MSTPDEYVKRAAEIGVGHITITDHGTSMGHPEMLEAGIKHGISIGLGIEGYFSATDRFDKRPVKERNDGTKNYNHIGIIAKNQKGLENLYAIQRKANMEGYYYKPRVDFELLEEYREGIIVLSGCMSGIVSQHLEEGDYETAKQWAARFQNLYGDDYYMEVMSHNPVEMTKGHFQIADELGISVVTTSDCHHASPDDLVLQEAMLILQTGPKEAKNWDLSKAQKMDWLERFNYVYPDRNMTFEKFELHLNTATEHLTRFKALGYDRTDFIENTVLLSEKIEGYERYEGLDLLPVPKVDDIESTFRAMVDDGARQRGTYGNPEYDARRQTELDLIVNKNYMTYFMVEKDFVDWSREQGIRVGPGRGSAAGSLVNYELGITDVDPIKHGLIFERFLDPSRDDKPDIDTDFQDDRRGEVKAYAKQQFKNTGNIMTFTYLEGKNIIKDAGKIIGVPYAERNSVSSMVEDWDDFLTNEKTRKFREKYPEIIELGNLLRGRLRSVGMHAAAVVMSKEPLDKYAAVESADDPDNKGSRVEVLAMDQHRAENLGLIKFDFLGLAALTKIQHTLEIIKSRYGSAPSMEDMTYDDPEVFKTFTKDGVTGIFQAEGAAFAEILDQMPIETFDDIVAATSLIRPGAADSSFGKKYLHARNGGSWHPYCEVMRPFTEETYGQILMQEQLMFTCVEVAGMSMADANKVRRIIGKKKDVSEFGPFRDAFVNGATERGNLTEKQAMAMWSDFEKAANYMFNKSHAVAYSYLTYQMAWLKHYYPVEFMYALLSTEGDSTTKILYLSEVKRLGIKLQLPHIEDSEIKMTIKDDEDGPYLLMGLTDVKYIGDAGAKAIIKARPFGSYERLMEKASEKYSGIPARGIEYLNRVGGCTYDDNPPPRDIREHLFEVLSIPAFDASILPDHLLEHSVPIAEVGNHHACITVALVLKITRKNGWQRADLFDETGTQGYFFESDVNVEKGKYYVFLLSNDAIVEAIPVEEVNTDTDFGAFLLTEELRPFQGHRILSVKTRRTKSGAEMGNVIVTNKNKELMAFTVFARQLEQVRYLARLGRPVDIEYKENEYRGKKSLVMESIK